MEVLGIFWKSPVHMHMKMPHILGMFPIDLVEHDTLVSIKFAERDGYLLCGHQDCRRCFCVDTFDIGAVFLRYDERMTFRIRLDVEECIHEIILINRVTR